MNILAFDNHIYLVNIDNKTDNVYMVNVKYKIIQGYDNIHKIMRFGNYSTFDKVKLNKELENNMLIIFNRYDIKPLN